MERKLPQYRAAVTQIAPCYLDLAASTAKACTWIEEAAGNGAKLIGFPEGFLPGYPWWAFVGTPYPYGMNFWKRLYKNAFEIPGPELAQIAECARKNNIYVCMSGTELDRGSLYLTQVWFSNKGDFMGKHRKIRPTLAERTVWGEGDGSTMPVFQTELGNLGGLMCWEHRMPGNILAMAAQNEQIHMAAWPTGNADEKHLFATAKNVDAAKYYAEATGTFVLMSSLVNTPEMCDILSEEDPEHPVQLDIGYGHAGIIDPRGNIVTPAIPHDQEGILYADIDLEEVVAAKYFIDCAGHYSKPSVTSLIFNREAQAAVKLVGGQAEQGITYEELSR